MSDYVEDKDYIFHNLGDYGTSIELKIDPFKDVMFSYGEVSVEEIDESAILHIEYNIISPGKYTEEELRNNTEFSGIIGDILTKILMDRLNGSN